MKRAKALQVGEVVFSTSGRDAGRFYLVVEVIDDEYVTIADGNLRKVDKPKKKKIKHLKTEEVIIEKIKDKIEQDKKIFDSEVKSSLRPYNG